MSESITACLQVANFSRVSVCGVSGLFHIINQKVMFVWKMMPQNDGPWCLQTCVENDSHKVFENVCVQQMWAFDT